MLHIHSGLQRLLRRKRQLYVDWDRPASKTVEEGMRRKIQKLCAYYATPDCVERVCMD